MKLLLVIPPQIFLKAREAPRVAVPTGMLYTLAVAEQKVGKGNAFFIDSMVDTRITPIPENNTLAHFGTPLEEIRKKIEEIKPDIVGIANQFSEQTSMANTIAKIAKEVNSNTLILMGGPHCATVPLDVLKESPYTDIVVTSEGEAVLPEIIGYKEGKKELKDMLGIAYRDKDNKPILNPRAPFILDLDNLPLPAYHLADMEGYFKAAKEGYDPRPDTFARSERIVSMVTSRGCPYNCSFCSVHANVGKRFRSHSPEKVIEHIELLANKYNVKHLHIEDDNLTLMMPRFEKILDLMIEKNLDLTWDTPNGVRVDLLDRNLLTKMKKAGCTNIKIAIESGDQWVLDNLIDKKLMLSKIPEAAQVCKELGIPLAAFYIIGFPHETKKQIETTLNYAYYLAKKYNVRPHINVAFPLLASRLYKEAKEEGLLKRDPYDKKAIELYEESLIKSNEWTSEDIRNYITKFYRKIVLLYLYKSLTNPKVIADKTMYALKNPKTAMNLVTTGINIYLMK